MTIVDQHAPLLVSGERPWGRFDQFATNEQVTVKIITVEPGQRLSLQRHHRRSELWTILDGPVDVEISGMAKSLNEGERAWIRFSPCTAWEIRRAIPSGCSRWLSDSSTRMTSSDSMTTTSESLLQVSAGSQPSTQHELFSDHELT